MYNTKHICGYNENNVFLEEEEKQLSREEKDFVLNCLYRNDLLYIFDLDDCEKYAEQVIHELYEKIKQNAFFLSCMKKVADNFNTDDEKMGLVLLYSFEYLYLVHPCVSEFLETGKIKDTNIKALKEKLFK